MGLLRALEEGLETQERMDHGACKGLEDGPTRSRLQWVKRPPEYASVLVSSGLLLRPGRPD